MIFNKTAYFVLKATFSSKNNKNQQKHQKNKKAANWKAKKSANLIELQMCMEVGRK